MILNIECNHIDWKMIHNEQLFHDIGLTINLVLFEHLLELACILHG